MGNTDENITCEERQVPKTIIMQNLVTAIRSKNIPQDLDKLLQNGQRFRIFSCVDKSHDNKNFKDNPYKSEMSLKDMIDNN